MPLITVGDTGLFVEQAGGGFPVLLIAGTSGLADSWAEQIPALARDFQVIAYDHRGVGRSERTPTPSTVEDLAADALSLMDKLGVERAHIVGHSAGSAVAQILALEHPKRVESLVLAASWHRPDPYFRRLYEFRREVVVAAGLAAYARLAALTLYPVTYIAENSEALSCREAQYLATSPSVETIVNRIDAVLGFDRSEQIHRITQPTLVIGAADDLVTPPHFSEALARGIPGAELKLFATGGNYFHRVVVREFNYAVTRFLQAHTPKI